MQWDAEQIPLKYRARKSVRLRIRPGRDVGLGNRLDAGELLIACAIHAGLRPIEKPYAVRDRNDVCARV